MEIERKGFNLTLPKVMERRMTKIKRVPRKMEIITTFLRVMIFIQDSLLPLTPSLSP
jgi:hypothetical protein